MSHVCAGEQVVATLGGLYNPAHPELSNMRTKIPTRYRVMRVLRVDPSSLEIGGPRKLPAVPGPWAILMIIPGPSKFEDGILNWPKIES